LSTDLQRVWPVVVVGAGAAGMTAAIFAARHGAGVLLLETRPKPGAKIRVSGGGRCNVLPSSVDIRDFHTSGSVFAARNVLFSWPLPEVCRFFTDDLRIPLKTEATGKVFPCSDDARDVVAALLDAAARAGVTLRSPVRVRDVELLPAAGDRPRFALRAANGESLIAERVVLATGGLSLPKTGSDGAGFEIAQRFGHRLVPRYPALVPLLGDDATWPELRGVAAPVTLDIERRGKRIAEVSGDLLVTHRGFSGPAVLDASWFVTGASEPTTLRVHWGGPQVVDWDALLQGGGRDRLGTLVHRHLPRRLGDRLLAHAAVDAHLRLAELGRQLRMQVVEALQRYVLPVTGNEGYATAEVTGGGVSLAEVELGGLESALIPGLHFCGEMLDVTGRLGGYNFLWAWVTGRKVGQAVAARLRN
jgi:predicted Rossmann fold flavoprotein